MPARLIASCIAMSSRTEVSRISPSTASRTPRQVQGGTLFGLTAALHGSITFKDGRVEQSNFDSYLPMRIDEVPVVETHLIKNAEAPGGIGEAPTRARNQPAAAQSVDCLKTLRLERRGEQGQEEE
jgi:hypothetical protein